MGFFIRFAELLVRCLCFRFSTYVVHAVSKNHFKPAPWAVTKKQRFKPSLLSAFREQQRGKEKGSYGGSAPKPP